MALNSVRPKVSSLLNTIIAIQNVKIWDKRTFNFYFARSLIKIKLIIGRNLWPTFIQIRCHPFATNFFLHESADALHERDTLLERDAFHGT